MVYKSLREEYCSFLAPAFWTGVPAADEYTANEANDSTSQEKKFHLTNRRRSRVY